MEMANVTKTPDTPMKHIKAHHGMVIVMRKIPGCASGQTAVVVK